MAEPRIVERNDPEDVFSLLSDDTRVEILQALWAAEDPVPFSELREAVGIGDSGQFNYHLDKLIDRFVRKTSTGYALTQAGKGINGVIEAGAYTMEANIEPVELDHPCPYCGGTRTLSYGDEVVEIECESCEVSYHFVVPPGVFAGYDQEAIPAVASRYLYATFHKIKSGFCWFCEGRTHPTVQTEEPPTESPDGDDPPGDGAGNPAIAEPELSDGPGPEETDGRDRIGELEEVPVVHYDCERCGHTATTGLWLATIDHPAVQRFYHEHGIDIRDRRVWEFPELDPDHLDVRSWDPVRVSITHTAAGETLTLVVDGEADIVEVSN